MCGIVGSFHPLAAASAAHVVAAMRDRMAHRGPDGVGVWTSPDRRCTLGHRRLSIIDLSAEAVLGLVIALAVWIERSPKLASSDVAAATDVRLADVQRASDWIVEHTGPDSTIAVVDFNMLGDPAPGCPKDFVAEWTCGDSPTVNRAESERAGNGEAGYGSIATLICQGDR